MKSTKSTIIYICITAGIALGAFGIASAAFNEQINFQGKLTDSNNLAVENGNYNFDFSLYATDTAGTALWTETATGTNQIAVTDGLFSYLLGSITSLSSVDFNQTLWLEVKVGATSTVPSWETLAPRKKLGAVPAAFEAKKLSGKLESAFATLAENETITGLWNFNNVLSIASSSASTTLTVTQNGAGSIIDIKNAMGSVFTINNAGQISVGTWQGTPISAGYGGTGQDWSAVASGSIPYFSDVGALSTLGPGTSGYYLKTQGAGQPPTWAAVSGANNYYGPTLIVAAADSTSTARAHYQCDGTNDEAEINQAINALPAAGGVVQLLEGTYILATSTYADCSIKMGNSTALTGSGASTVLKIKNSFNANLNVICNSDAVNGNSRIVINNLKLDGNRANNSSGTQRGIYFQYLYGTTTPGFIVEKAFIENFRNIGVMTLYSENNILSDCFIKNNNLDGIFLSYSSKNIVADSIFTENGDAITLSNSEYNTVTGNISQENTLGGVYLTSSDNNTITGNVIQGNTTDGVELSSSDNNIVTANKIIGNGGSGNYDGINITGDNNLISSNDITDTVGGATAYAIEIVSGSNNYLVGNRYSGTGASSIKDSGTNTIYGGQLYGTNTVADLILKPLGNVGIGTTSPASLLELYSFTSNTDLTITAATSSTHDARIVFRTGAAAPTTRFVMGVDQSDSNKFKIATSTLGTNDLFTIDYTTGNLTMGTISTGTWQGTPIAYNYGGTGTTTALALQNLWWGDGSGGLVQIASSTLTGAAAGVSSLNTLTGALTLWGTNSNLTVTASGTVGFVFNIGTDVATTGVATLSSLTSIGTIATGTWQATPIGPAYGGTGTSTASWTGVPYITAGTWGTTTVTVGTNNYGPTIIVAAVNSTNTARAHYICDGTNDQDEINQAIQSIYSTGGTVLLLEGTYNISSSTNYKGIDIATSSISLIGSGRGTVLKRATTTSDGIITVGDGGTTAVSGAVIADLQIDGVKATYSGSSNDGIFFNQKVSSSKILNTWIHDNDGAGIRLTSTNGSENKNNLIEGNEIKDNDYRGISLTQSDYNVIANNNFPNTNGASNAYEGIYLSSSNYNIISDNNLRLTEDNAIELDSSSYNKVSGNAIGNPNKDGIYLNDSSYNTISGNNINAFADGSYGIEIKGTNSNNIISSNEVIKIDVGLTSGIYIAGTDNYLIGNEVSVVGMPDIADGGTNTTIQQRDWFEVEASTTLAALTVSQIGTGTIMSVSNSAGTVFVINNAGTIATGTWQGTPIAYNYGGTGTTTALALQNLWWGDGSGGLVQIASSTLTGAAAGVSSLNTLTGALTLWGTNSNLTVTASGTVGLVFNVGTDVATTGVATLSSLTSIGTIATGTWQATPIGPAYGGTGTSTASWTGVPYITAGTWGTTTAGTGDITDVFNCSSGDCSSIIASDGDFLDLSAINMNIVAEGLKLPQTTDCGTSSAEGAICWDTDQDRLYIGDGAVIQKILPQHDIDTSSELRAILTDEWGTGYAIFSGATTTNWDTAYSHSQLTSGNPHNVTKSDVGLSSVENIALSAWGGSENILSIGTIATGTWQATPIGPAYGGTGTSTASWTGVPYITAGIWSTTTALSSAITSLNGLTGAVQTFATSNDTNIGLNIVSSGSAHTFSLQWIGTLANARIASSTYWSDSALTVYSSSSNWDLAFGWGNHASAGYLNSSNLYWVASGTALYSSSTFTNVGIGTTTPEYVLDVYGTLRAVSTSTFSGRVGIGTSTPARMLEILDASNPQMRITQAASKYAEFEVESDGDLNVTLAASNNNLVLSTYNLYVCAGGCPSFSLSNGGNLVVENESYFAGDKIQYPSSLGQPKRSIILTSAGAITPTVRGASQTKVDGTNSTYYVLGYADATTSSAFWEWIMPDSFATATAATSVIDVTIYWTATTTGNVIWGLQTIGVSNNENIDQVLGNTATTTGAAQATSTFIASVTFSNYVVDWMPQDYISFNVYREGGSGADTLTANARLVKVKIEYAVKQESD